MMELKFKALIARDGWGGLGLAPKKNSCSPHTAPTHSATKTKIFSVPHQSSMSSPRIMENQSGVK